MKKIIAVIIIIILLIVIKNTIASIYAKITFDSPVATLSEELSDLKQENKFLQEQYKYVKTNDFIEETARRKLGMVKAGEHIIIAPLASESAKEEITDTRPNWEKWWKLFF
jgi:cell division protein DivIC